MMINMKQLWRPIETLTDKYAPNLLLCAPELVDLDCNEAGIGMGYWQDDLDLPEKGSWLCAKWDMTDDEWREVSCTPTHYIVMEGP